jgi:hypothetical protein
MTRSPHEEGQLHQSTMSETLRLDFTPESHYVVFELLDQSTSMTFLNPFVFIGLLAAGIPILLHLFNLRKLQTIEFSTLTFLKELQKTKIRRLKMKQLLLLILRTLLIILVVTAFARPTLRGTFGTETVGEAKTTSVFLIDDSYSMTSVEEQGELLKQAKEAALNILDMMKDGDEVFLVKLSDVTETASRKGAMAQRNFRTARTEINAIKPSFIHRTLEDGLRYSAMLLANSKNFNKEVYIFSDFQIGSLQNKTHPGVVETLFTPEVRFFLLSFGTKTRQNLGIEAVKLGNSILTAGKPFTIKVKVQNGGDAESKNSVVSVFLKGTRVAQKALDIPSAKTVQTEFTLTLSSTGYADGMVEIQDDDLEFDNRAQFTVNIPEKLKVLLVGLPSDLRYIKLALSSRPPEGESILYVAETTPERLSPNEIRGTDVIVFSNVRDLTAQQRADLRTFVDGGGGLVYFPGSRTDSASFASNWSDELRIPRLLALQDLSSQQNQIKSVLGFGQIDFRHPVFEGMFSDDQQKSDRTGGGRKFPPRSLESAEIIKYARYASNAGSTIVIGLSDGSAFLLEQASGKTVAFLFSVSATNDWSNFPTRGLFVPLLHRAVSYLGQKQLFPAEFLSGEEARIGLGSISTSTVTVRNPEQIESVVNLMRVGREGIIRYDATTIPGVYGVYANSALIKKFVVTVDPDESQTKKSEISRIESMFKRLGVMLSAVRSIVQSSDAHQAIMESRLGTELWKSILMAALIVAIIEVLVSRNSRKDIAHQTHP